ncbi:MULTISPECIES: PLD nuclease N-terminal domain-containing protein [unclassified Frankia]|uniref:PLD nuclease N-terminal domain-containing protein n=1 Tax=unclassified Frankia TaxID=2632575 RepID=UPI0027DB0E72|nr:MULTISPECIES: PLD nuclease N-terminal domain-containing protein [unclassified Frankia]
MSGEQEGDGQPVTLLLYIVFYALLAYVIVDVARTPREDVRTLTKTIWIVLALLLYPIGGVLWFFFGRPRSSAVRRRRGMAARRDHPAYGGRFDIVESQRVAGPSLFRGRSRTGPPAGPVGPDDDPEFLRELTERLRRENPDGPASHH